MAPVRRTKFEIIAECLNEWLKLRAGSLTKEPETSIPRASFLNFKEETDPVLTNGAAVDRNQIDCLCRWWLLTFPGVAMAERRLEFLHFFLEELDRAFAKEVPIPHHVGNNQVAAFGMSWWLRSAEEISGQSFIAPIPTAEVFPNLRIFRNETHEFRNVWSGCHFGGRIKRAPEGPTLLKIGLHSLPGIPTTTFSPTQPMTQGFGFEALGWQEDSPHYGKYVAGLEACVTWAKAEGVHVLCLPELSVCPGGRTLLQKAIQTHAPSSLCMILPGSFHVRHGAARENQTPLWLVSADGLVEHGCFAKLSPYDGIVKEPAAITEHERRNGLAGVYAAAQCAGKQHIIEEIARGRPVRVFSKLGFLAVAICKDQMESSSNDRLLHPPNDHVFNLSMMEAPRAQFYEKEAARAGSATYYVNAIHAMDPAAVPNSLDAIVGVFWQLPKILVAGGALTKQKLQAYGIKMEGRFLARELLSSDRSAGVVCQVPVPTAYLNEILKS